MAPRKKPEPEKPTEPRPVGRPTRYDPAYAEQAAKLCAIGICTDPQLAEFFEVSTTTIYNWKADHPEFLEAIKLNKELADDQIEQSLSKRAHGYEYEIERIEEIDGKRMRVGTGVMVYVPPDPTSMIFWLKNRRRQEWLDGMVIKHELPTAEEIAAAKKKLEGEV